MKKIISFILLLYSLTSSGQTIWKSNKYSYYIEIPSGFSISKNLEGNVDFKANYGNKSIVIVIKTLSNKFKKNTLWEDLGNLETYSNEWETFAKEYMNKPKFLKYGKTTINDIETFWYDYTTENPKLYSKTYQTKKENIIYTFTLTCDYKDYNQYSAIWYRFKEKIILN